MQRFVDFIQYRIYTLTMSQDKQQIWIRKASPEDMPFIGEHLTRFMLDDEDLDHRQFVVAIEGQKLVGFGRIIPHKRVYELGGIGVIEDKRNRGIGTMIVEYLKRIFPSDDVYIITDIPGYFERLGFAKAQNPPEELLTKIERVCRTKCHRDGVVMLFKRKKPDDCITLG